MLSQRLRATKIVTIALALGLTLAPLACQVREAGEVVAATASPEPYLSASVISFSDKPNDLGIRLSFYPKAQMKLSRERWNKKGYSGGWQRLDDLVVTAGEDSFDDHVDTTFLWHEAEQIYRYRIIESSERQFDKRYLEVKLRKDIAFKMEGEHVPNKELLGRSIYSNRLWFPSTPLVFLNGQIRFQSSEWMLPTGASVVLKDGGEAITKKLTPPGNLDIDDESTFHYAGLSVKTKVAKGKLTVVLDNTKAPKNSSSLSLDILEPKDFSMEVEDRGPRHPETSVTALLGENFFYYRDGKKISNEDEIGWYRQRLDNEEGYCFSAYNNRGYHFYSQVVEGEPLLTSNSRIIDERRCLTKERVDFTQVDPALTEQMNGFKEVHDMARALRRILGAHGIDVILHRSISGLAHPRCQVHLLKLVQERHELVAKEMNRRGVDELRITNTKKLDDRQVEISAKCDTSPEEDFRALIKQIRAYNPSRH